MYTALELALSYQDLHRFFWRRKRRDTSQYYRMTHVTFGVSASLFAMNMSVKQNTLDFASNYPQVVDAIEKLLYVDGLTGTDSTHKAIELQGHVQDIFSRGGFLLHKWNSSESAVMQHIPSELRETWSSNSIPSPDEYTKTLGIK